MSARHPAEELPRPVGPGPILLVDDDSLDLRLARRCHTRSGIGRPMETFDNGPALIERVERGEPAEPALILVDLRMPGMDGFEVIERLQSSGRLPKETPIAVLTTSTLDADRERARALGAASYLVKPTSTAEFVQFFGAWGP